VSKEEGLTPLLLRLSQKNVPLAWGEVNKMVGLVVAVVFVATLVKLLGTVREEQSHILASSFMEIMKEEKEEK
jgi:hypothetical protein